MFFGCMGLVPTYSGGSLNPYSGAIAFAGIVAVVIVVSFTQIYILIDFFLSLNLINANCMCYLDHWSYQ